MSQATDADTPSEPLDDQDGSGNHLDDLEGSVGCTEIWEKMNERRSE